VTVCELLQSAVQQVDLMSLCGLGASTSVQLMNQHHTMPLIRHPLVRPHCRLIHLDASGFYPYTWWAQLAASEYRGESFVKDVDQN